MIVNQEALAGLYTGFKTVFNKAYGEVQPIWTKVATKVPSSTREEDYKWLGSFPGMREWIGERQLKNLSAASYVIRNKSFESTVSVPREDIEDDTIGIYQPMVQEMAQAASAHPDELIFTLLKKGFVEKCYDGKPFFAADHPVGKLKVSNKGTAALSVESYGAARTVILSMKDENGKSLNLVPNLLVVPPALEGMGLRILQSEQIDSSTNIYKGTAELLVVPELAGEDTAWYLLCTTRPLKPLIYQERKAPKFEALTNPQAENVFMTKNYLYGVDDRCNVGYGFWQMAYGSTGK